jgi:hypothetical protein
MRKLVTVALVAVAAISVVSLVRADEKKPIKQIMKEAHTPQGKSLLDKVSSGKAEKEDAEKLLALYKALGENEPKKGDREKWKEKVSGIVSAAEKVVEGGDKAAPAALKKAAACAGCHSIYK